MSVREGVQQRRARWRDYRTAGGRRPVKEFLDRLSDNDAAAVLDAMREVRDEGLAAARHLEDEIWEVRVDGLHAYSKKEIPLISYGYGRRARLSR
jgi:hypothetical protein